MGVAQSEQAGVVKGFSPWFHLPRYLGVPPPFFPGILLSRNPPETRERTVIGFRKERWLKRMEWNWKPPLEDTVFLFGAAA